MGCMCPCSGSWPPWSPSSSDVIHCQNSYEYSAGTQSWCLHVVKNHISATPHTLPVLIIDTPGWNCINGCAAQQWFTRRFILLSLESAYHGVHVGRQWLMTILVSIMMSFTVKSVMLWFHTMQSPTHIILLLWFLCMSRCFHFMPSTLTQSAN